MGPAHGVEADRDVHRPRVPALQAVQPLWERLHLRQVRGGGLNFLISGNINCFWQCCWNGTDSAIMTGSYNNFFRWVLDLEVIISFKESFNNFSLDVLQFWLIRVNALLCRMFDRSSRKEVTLEASREVAKPKTMLKPRKVKRPHSNCYYPSKWHLLIIFSNEQVCSGGKRKKDEISVDCLDFNKKILHTAWHPQVRLEATNLSLLQGSLFFVISVYQYWYNTPILVDFIKKMGPFYKKTQMW